MSTIHVLYDFDLEAAYDVELMSDECVSNANEEHRTAGHTVRWITYEQFRSIRKQYIIAVVAKEGEFCTSKLAFRSREAAEETARMLGGVVREIAVF